MTQTKRRNKKYKPMQLAINEKVLQILEDDNTMIYLAHKLIRRRPKYFPHLIWKGLLWIVMAPAAKERPHVED